MEKRNYDQDEILIRQALGNQFPSNIDIIKGVEVEVKPRKMLKKGFVMALIAASLMVVTVSAAYHIGAFERLTALIGQERADELIPLEIGNIGNVDSTQPQLPQSDDTSIAEEVHLHDGIAIELVAIEITDDAAYIYFTLQDLIANRLEGEFFIIHSILPVEQIDDFTVSTGSPEIIHRDTSGIITLRSRFMYSHTLDGLELTYNIREIRFDDFYHPLQVLDINLADFAFDAPTVLLQTYGPAVGSSSIEGEDITRRYAAQIMEEGLHVLTPHMLDIELGLDRVHSIISSIGVVNGRLHIQIFNPDMRESSVRLWMIHNDDMDMLDNNGIFRRSDFDLFDTQFRVAEDGSLYRNAHWNIVDTHLETVYDIDLSNIHEYGLAISAFGAERICIDWTVTFDISNFR